MALSKVAATSGLESRWVCTTGSSFLICVRHTQQRTIYAVLGWQRGRCDCGGRAAGKPATALESCQGPVKERRTNLSLERIVSAAIAIADTEGLSALSMARLADRLGSAPMSLYRHVASKEELYDFMIDAAAGELVRYGEERLASRADGVDCRSYGDLSAASVDPPAAPDQAATRAWPT